MSCPTCGACDGYIRTDHGEPVWMACREHRVRWLYRPADDVEDAGFLPAWLDSTAEALLPEVLSYPIVEPRATAPVGAECLHVTYLTAGDDPTPLFLEAIHRAPDGRYYLEDDGRIEPVSAEDAARLLWSWRRASAEVTR